MNWVTTNIRFPEDLYDQLKREAAARRISLSELVRQRTAGKQSDKKNTSSKAAMKRLNQLAKRIGGQNKGINLTQAVIDMRYEQ